MAATATSQTPLRDDSTARSLSLNERAFLRSTSTSRAAAVGGSTTLPRTDGRHPTETRPLRLTFGRSHASSECTVRFGPSTRVAASVGCALIPPPNRDRPNDGLVRFGVELSPMASAGFGSGAVYSAGGGDDGGAPAGGGPMDRPQKLTTNRILRTLERTLLSSGAFDSEALCVQSGEWVWRLTVHVVVLDDGGNLVDASVLAAVGALRHFRKPEVNLDGGEDDGGGGGGGPVVLSSDEREPSPLPLHHTPLTVTFALFSDRDSDFGSASTGTVAAFLDPTEREELVADGTVTLAYNKHGELCGLDYPGGTELRPNQLVKCAKLGEDRCLDWCHFLEDALVEADGKATEERMGRLKAAAASASSAAAAAAPVPLPPPPAASDGAPFAERTDPARDGTMMQVGRTLDDVKAIGSEGAADAAAAAAAAEEEERYRLQALDYALGHVAAKVKEDGKERRQRQRQQRGGPVAAAPSSASAPSSLMDAMLRSAAGGTTGGDDDDGGDDGGGGGGDGGSPSPRPRREALASGRTREAEDEFDRYAASASAAAGAGAGADADAASEPDNNNNHKTKKNKAAAPKATPDDTTMDDDDDDEEEVTTLLHSEFGSINEGGPSPPSAAAAEAAPVADAERKGSSSKKQKEEEEEEKDAEDDVDDLAMAVIKKKKGKKSKKAKKGK